MMMFTINYLVILVLFALPLIFQVSLSFEYATVIKHVVGQIDEALVEIESQRATQIKSKQPLVSPRTINIDGNLVMVSSSDWTSGFFSGTLWHIFEAVSSSKWERIAKEFTDCLEPEQFNNHSHDTGFKMLTSFGNGYRMTHDHKYIKILMQSARTMATRFSPKVGAIKSWDFAKTRWDFPVIIDGMMNLELLLWAHKQSGEKLFLDIAVSHANATLRNHFRDDASSYHVVDYSSNTGEVIKRVTHQGYSAESAWARGQAWGLYGFTVCYRETKHKAYLDHAEKIASFLLNHPIMPEDLVPPWDFDDPLAVTGEAPRDASAAAVMSSALFQLGALASSSDSRAFYLKTAEQILRNLVRGYMAPIGSSKGFLLLHSTGQLPMNKEIDVPLAYADYYFMEALVRGPKWPDILK